MIPSTAVIARPGGGIALGTGIRGAGEHEWPFLRLKFAQTLIRRADILHAEHMVDGAMVARGAIVKTMNSIERHGLVRAKEDGRFVHVVPKARHSHAHEILIQAAPPVPCACESEIRKYAVARPHLPDVNGAIGILDEHVVLDSGVVRSVTVFRVFLDVQVGDKNAVKALRAKIRNHLFKAGEIFPVDREGGIVLLIVDVEIDGIGRNLFLSKGFDDLAGPGFGIVGVATLLITERPVRAVYSSTIFFGSGPAMK